MKKTVEIFPTGSIFQSKKDDFEGRIYDITVVFSEEGLEVIYNSIQEGRALARTFREDEMTTEAEKEKIVLKADFEPLERAEIHFYNYNDEEDVFRGKVSEVSFLIGSEGVERPSYLLRNSKGQPFRLKSINREGAEICKDRRGELSFFLCSDKEEKEVLTEEKFKSLVSKYGLKALSKICLKAADYKEEEYSDNLEELLLNAK